MKSVKVLAWITLMIGILAACGPDIPDITEGKVINRSFEPAHWEGGYDQEPYITVRCHPVSTYSNGQYRTTTQCGPETAWRSVWDPHDRWEEDRWRIEIDGCVEYEDDGQTKEHCDTRWITVSEYDYNRFTIGDHYPSQGEIQH